MKYREINRWFHMGSEIPYLTKEYNSHFVGWLLWTDSDEHTYGYFTHNYLEGYHEITREEANQYSSVKKFKLEHL